MEESTTGYMQIMRWQTKYMLLLDMIYFMPIMVLLLCIQKLGNMVKTEIQFLRMGKTKHKDAVVEISIWFKTLALVYETKITIRFTRFSNSVSSILDICPFCIGFISNAKLQNLLTYRRLSPHLVIFVWHCGNFAHVEKSYRYSLIFNSSAIPSEDSLM